MLRSRAMYEIYEERVLAHSGHVRESDIIQHKAFLNASEGFDSHPGMEIRLDGLDNEAVWVKPSYLDADREFCVNVNDLLSVFGKLRQLAGDPLENIGPTLTDEQRERAAEIFERAAQELEAPSPTAPAEALTGLATELRSVGLQLIHGATRPIYPGTLVGE